MKQKLLIAILVISLLGIIWFAPFVLLWSLVAVLSLVALILIIPVSSEFWYDSETGELKLNLTLFWIVKIKLLPRIKKEKKQKSKKKTESKQDKDKKEVKEKKKLSAEGIVSTISDVVDMLPSLSRELRKLLRCFKFKNVDIAYGIVGKDAADTAISYGKQCGYILTGLNFLAEYLCVSYRAVDIFPDFTNQNGKSRIYIHFVTKTALMAIVIVSVAAIYRLLPQINKVSSKSNKNNKKVGNENGK